MGDSLGQENHPDPQESAALLRRLLEAVERGELEANTPQARALLRHLEGAVSALEALEEGPADEEGGH